MGILEKLTENLPKRSNTEAVRRLCEKWEKTGLLDGLPVDRRSMALLNLPNQAGHLLREIRQPIAHFIISNA